MRQLWIIEPRDTLFFRGGQPFTAGESGYLRSEFPPSPQVLQGFVRTTLLAAHGISWEAYAQDRCDVCGTAIEDCAAGKYVGPAGSLTTRFQISGPFLLRRPAEPNQPWVSYYPVPKDLVRTEDGGWHRLEPGQDPVPTDLGRLRLPAAVVSGVRTVDGWWMTEQALVAYLAGQIAALGETNFLTPPQVATDEAAYKVTAQGDSVPPVGFLEPRTLIQIDRATGRAADHMLASTAHFRFNPLAHLALGVYLDNLPAHLSPADGTFSTTLGGESRQVYVTVTTGNSIDTADTAAAINHTQRFRLVLLQPTLFAQGWLPDGFTPATAPDGTVTWHGQLNGVPCRLISACIGKPVRIGGWNIRERCSRPMYTLVPPGSVYFFEATASGEEVVTALHDRHIGNMSEIGYGWTVIGRW